MPSVSDRRRNDPEKHASKSGLVVPERRRIQERRGVDPSLIPIELDTRPIHTCIYVEQFRFRECTIKTCKNYTDVTATKCLAIDRVQPVGNKIISDAELHLYKYSKEKVSTRLISLKRKKAIMKVKAILILHSLLEYIRENYKPKGRVFKCNQITKVEAEYPLKIRKLQFQNWMWPYLISKKVWRKFVTKKGGECSIFKPYTLLNLDRTEFDSLISKLKEEKHELVSIAEAGNDRRIGKQFKKLVRVGGKRIQPKR